MFCHMCWRLPQTGTNTVDKNVTCFTVVAIEVLIKYCNLTLINSFGQKLLNFLFTGMLVPNWSISHWNAKPLVDSNTQEVDQFFNEWIDQL